MTIKQYKIVSLTTTVALAIIVSQALIFKNWIIPLAAVAVSFALLLMLRKKVKAVLADERDFEIGGKAARIAMQIYSWIAVAVIFVFYANKDANPAFWPVAMSLAFSVCFLMLLYSFIFRFYARKN